MKARGATREEVEALLLPTELLDGLRFNPILEADSIESAKRLIEKLGMYSLPKKIVDPIFLEASLWRSYYDVVFKRISKIPISDREDVKGLLGMELDLINLKTCLLSIARGYDLDFTRRFLIRNPEGIPLEKLLRLLEKRDERLLLEHFPVYRAFLEKALSEEEWALEVERFRAIKRVVNSKRLSKFVSFFYVLKYLLDLEVEYRNLRAIATFVHHNIPLELRRALLILV